jgi:four helix bundle protein
LFSIADQLEERKRFRFAEQLRGAALSITNNIAEGSGSFSNAEFKQFLNYARRSAFECASMLLVYEREGSTNAETTRVLLKELDEISRMITAFARSLD